YEAHLIDRLEDGQLTTDEIITRVRILRNAEIVRDEKLPTVKDNKDGRLMFSFKNIRRERFNSLEDVTVSLQLDKNGYLSIADIKRRAPEEFAESWVEITSNKGNLTGNIVFIEDKDGKPILDKEGKPLAVSVEANILEQVRSRREPADEGMISIYDTKTGEFITACNGLSKEEFDSLEDVEIVTTLGKNGQLRIGGNNRRNFTLFPEAKVKFRVISGEISILTFLSDKQGNPVSVRDGEPLEVDFREDMYSQLRNRISGYRGQPVRASGKIYESKKELSEGMKEALIGREVPIKIAEYVRKSLTNRSGGGITAWQQRISDFRISGLISKIQEQSIRALYEGRADRFDMERFADTIFENVNRFKQDSESYTDIQIGIILGRGLSYRRYQRMRRAYPELTKTGFIDALYQNINYKDSLSSRHKRRNNRIDNISLIKSALISSGISEEFAERLTVVLVNKNVFRVRLVRKRFLDNGLLTEKQIKILSYLESCPPKEFNAEFKPSEFAKLALKEMDKFKSATGNLRFAANQVEQLLVKGYTLRRFVALIQKYGLTKRIVYRIVKKYSNPEPVLEKLNKKIVSLNKLHNLPLYIIREIAYQGKEVEAGIDSIASYAQVNGTYLSLAYNLYSFYQLDESSIREAIRVLSREYSGLSNNYLSRVQTFIDEIESLAAAIEALKQNDEKGLLSPRERLARVKELKPVAGIEALMKIVLTGSYYHARQLVTETCRVKNSEYEWESPTINVDPATLNAAREIMAAQDRINGAKSLIESKWREFVPYLEKFEQKEKVILLRAADIYLRSGIYSGLNTPEVLGIIGEVGLDDFINKFIVVLLYQKGTARIKRLLRMTQSGLLTQGQKSILLNEDFTQLPKNLETEELIKRLYENIILFAREGNFSRTLITDIIVNGGYSWQTINELLLTFSNLSRKKLREAMKSKDPDRYLFTHFGLVKHYVDEAERAVKSGRDLDEGQLFALIINGRIHKGDLRAGQLNTQALNIIVDRNQLLIEELARKYSPSYELNEEFLSIAKSALLEAAWEYTPVYNQKDGFLEYARAVMEQKLKQKSREEQRAYFGQISLSTPVSDEKDAATLEDFISDPDSGIDSEINRQRLELMATTGEVEIEDDNLREALESLPKLQQDVIKSLVILEMSMEEACEAFNLEQEELEDIRDEAILRLREFMDKGVVSDEQAVPRNITWQGLLKQAGIILSFGFLPLASQFLLGFLVDFSVTGPISLAALLASAILALTALSIRRTLQLKSRGQTRAGPLSIILNTADKILKQPRRLKQKLISPLRNKNLCIEDNNLRAIAAYNPQDKKIHYHPQIIQYRRFIQYWLFAHELIHSFSARTEFLSRHKALDEALAYGVQIFLALVILIGFTIDVYFNNDSPDGLFTSLGLASFYFGRQNNPGLL
ncbi:MAG: sigma-70 family RNA polymerase sigma factor, partial [Candidatus Omnitrophica bacterium]|nr:sigma-70 family RNA polymerase sigma factor [Candidatus Omnitrophota bacterium]